MSNAKKQKFEPRKHANQITESVKTQNAEALASLSVSEYKHAMSAVSRFLDPESSSNDDLCTFSETGRTSTIFRPKIVQDLNLGPSGLFRVIAHPRFYRPVGMTDFSLPLSQYYEAQRVYAIRQGADVRMVIPKGKPCPVPLTFFPTTEMVPLPAAELVDYDSSSVFYPTWNADANGGTWFYNFSRPRELNITLRLEQWKISSSSGVQLTTVSATGAYTTLTLTPAAVPDQNLGYVYSYTGSGIAGFGFSVRPSSPIRAHSVAIYFNASNVFPDEECVHFFDSAISNTVQDAADAFINLGMSAWIQYTGADLVNGGETGGYRYPPDNLAKYTSLTKSYSTVASTPGALVGKIKQGAWGFYLPQSAQEMDFAPLESYDNLGYILINGKKNSTEASIRLNFNQVLLVSTTNQAFSKQIVAADPCGLTSALTMLRLLPGVIPNDGHAEKIRRIKALLKQHYPAIKKGLKTVGQVVKTVAPVVAAIA